MNKVKEFWINSYRSDKTAFYYEMLSFVFTVGASLILAVTANNPDMTLVYPGFFIGSVLAIVAYKRRQLVWPFLLTIYFACVNILGYLVAIGMINYE
tara:strand:- start:1292 stop:1582 length:291 start_codon:yes stop_codon:yes gene_type:complete